MSEIPLISQGDGFLYRSLSASMGGFYPSFTWSNQANVWIPVPYTGSISLTGAPPFQYMNAQGWFQPPVAGWWQIFQQGRPYANSGAWAHWLGLFLNGVSDENLIACQGGQRTVQATNEKIVYLNGTTDFIASGIMTTFTGTNTRTFNSTQYNLRAFYIRP